MHRSVISPRITDADAATRTRNLPVIITVAIHRRFNILGIRCSNSLVVVFLLSPLEPSFRQHSLHTEIIKCNVTLEELYNSHLCVSIKLHLFEKV